MTETLNTLLRISLVSFMAGNLLGMGLQLRLGTALVGLRNARFVSYSLLWCFVLCPAVAWGLTRLIPLAPPYAMGLILLGLTPCAPFLPMMVDRARGDTRIPAAAQGARGEGRCRTVARELGTLADASHKPGGGTGRKMGCIHFLVVFAGSSPIPGGVRDCLACVRKCPARA
jgi:hypothetical protein